MRKGLKALLKPKKQQDVLVGGSDQNSQTLESSGALTPDAGAISIKSNEITKEAVHHEPSAMSETTPTDLDRSLETEDADTKDEGTRPNSGVDGFINNLSYR
jgi:hypothetical protein